MNGTETQKPNTYMTLYEEGKSRLAAAHIREYEIDARYLLLFVYGIDMNDMLKDYAAPFDEKKEALVSSYLDAVSRRAEHIPLQHITHTQYFCGYEFYVDEHVLIPRLDTEILVEEALKDLKPKEHGQGQEVSLLDLCTGSGCIAVVLKKAAPFLSVSAGDVSPEAVSIAKENAESNGAEIEFRESDMFGAFAGQTFDMITCNPPYIRTRVIDMLAPEVKDHEPHLALDGTEDGLHYYRMLAAEAGRHLRDGGKLCLEIGFDQAQAVSALLTEAGFLHVSVVKDLAGLDRVVKAERNGHV